MIFIKIVLRQGKEFSFPKEKVLAILESEDQMVRIHDEKGWTGTSINKADISYTEYDPEKTREWRNANTKALPEPEGDSLPQEEIRQKVSEISRKLNIRNKS